MKQFLNFKTWSLLFSFGIAIAANQARASDACEKPSNGEMGSNSCTTIYGSYFATDCGCVVGTKTKLKTYTKKIKTDLETCPHGVGFFLGCFNSQKRQAEHLQAYEVFENCIEDPKGTCDLWGSAWCGLSGVINPYPTKTAKGMNIIGEVPVGPKTLVAIDPPCAQPPTKNYCNESFQLFCPAGSSEVSLEVEDCQGPGYRWLDPQRPNQNGKCCTTYSM